MLPLDPHAVTTPVPAPNSGSAPLPPPALVPPPSRPARAWRFRMGMAALALAGVAAWTAAAFVLGAGYGHRQADQSAPEPQPVTQVTVVVQEVPPTSPGSADADTLRAPDVSGLDENTARRVVAGAASDVDVTVSTRPAAGQSGLVIDQDPAPGELLAGSVTLVLSASAELPDVTGQAQADARATLEALGATVFINRTYVAGTQPGTALSTEPAAGAAMPATVTLIVAEPPASVALADVEPVEGGCSLDRFQANAVMYDNALRCSTSTNGSAFGVNLNRVVEQFTATLAIWDTNALDDAAVVEVSADGVVVLTQPVVFGQSVPIDIATTGVLRLTIRFITPETKDNTEVVLGDASLIGSEQGIDSLDLRS